MENQDNYTIRDVLRDLDKLCESEEIMENSNRYRRLKKALFGDPSGKIRTFAIISADNPLGVFTKEEWNDIKYSERNEFNKDNRKQLKQKLSQADAIKRDGEKALGYGGFDYVQIKGKYDEHERTFMIFNLTQKDAESIARCYGQESYFYGRVSIAPDIEPSSIAYYQTYNNCKTYKLVEISRTVSDESDAQDFFSKYGLKFRINMREFGDKVTPVKNHGMFEESFTRPTFMSRGRARRIARQPVSDD